MPRNGSGVYSLPGTYEAVSGEAIEAQQHNDPLEDLESDANAARPIVAGGTGAATAQGAIDNIFDVARTIKDAFLKFVDPSDATKTVRLDAGNITTGNDRVITAADRNIDMAKLVSGEYAMSLSASERSQARSNISAALKGHIDGLTLSNNSTDATNDIDIAAGEAASTETNPVLMVLASALTKRLDASWAVGTGNGGLDTGSVANAKYYVWLIRRSDTGVVDALFSTSNSSPTMPTNYDQKRLIGSFARVSGANTVPRSSSEADSTEWVAYTPTFQGFGTPSSVTVFSRRVGDTLQIRGKFTTGTVTAVEARLSLGFNGANGGVVSDATKVPSRQLCGAITYSNTMGSTWVPVLTIGSELGYVNFGNQSSADAGLNLANGNIAAGTGWTVAFTAEIPISGW